MAFDQQGFGPIGGENMLVRSVAFQSEGFVSKEDAVEELVEGVEELKFDGMKQLVELDRKDNVMIFLDSMGNLASKKEVDDAIDGKSVADMTRAKQFKSLFRMVTPYLSMLAAISAGKTLSATLRPSSVSSAT